ncbi:MAG: putative peptidoglycan glycosyltransferase FtsW [Clostridia bacterium]|nr:putative peptidoglycan glycosyltransferase FtsW [Clostridia bacterium]
MKKRSHKKFRMFSIRAGLDLPFLIIVLVLVATGLVMLFSASYANAYYLYGDSYYFIKSQLPMAIFGIAGMIFVSYFDYHHLHKFALLSVALSFVLLVLVLFMPAVNDVHRWVQLGSFSFQASEITKFAVVLFFAHSISVNFKKMGTFKYGILPYMCLLIPTIILLLLEPHISCVVIVVTLAVIMLFIGGVKLRWFALALIVLLVAAYILYAAGKFGYANTRIMGWLDPFNKDIWQETWQTRNSLYAIGSGGLLGLGLGNSRQKYLYLPEPQNDFIFAVVCEELGFIGAVIILLLFALLVWRGITISIRSKDKFGSLLGIGLTVQVGLQAVLNVGVVTNILPNTGISLPFFSHGGTSLIILLLEMGVVLSISRTSRIEKAFAT